ncbi:MAG: hypothetical protein ACRDJU_08425, partial [Actinomycetota bacterium]
MRRITADPMRAVDVVDHETQWSTWQLEAATRCLASARGQPHGPRRDQVWWDACAWCPDGARAIGERERTVVILYGRALRRVHPACLPYALAAGASVAPPGLGAAEFR